MTFELQSMPSFGVAGNFTGHLEQAGEAVDFVNIKTAEANAPKVVFPTFIPKNNSVVLATSEGVPAFLRIFPFDSEKIIFPKNEEKIQIEPECAILCSVKWDGEKIVDLMPEFFAASNDCSIRKEGAKKISMKKNWGASSKGLSIRRIKIDSFTVGGIMDSYRIASFLIRDEQIFDYGEDSPISGYSYIYEKLVGWLIEKFNTQQDEGPAENIHQYLVQAGKPENFMISIGATRYTDFGEHNFLQSGDRAVIVLYPENKYTHEQVSSLVFSGDFSDSEISVLSQIVTLEE